MPAVNVIVQACFMFLDAMLCFERDFNCVFCRCVFFLIYKTYMAFCIIPLLSDYYLLVDDRKLTSLSLF